MFCCRVESCSWVVNWHIIPDTVGLRSERLPCPETAAPHSVQKTSKWGLITLPCWILPSNSTFVLVVSAKSPNYIAEAFHPACVLLNSAKHLKPMCMTDVSFSFFQKESVRKKSNWGLYEADQTALFTNDNMEQWLLWDVCGYLKCLILYPFISVDFLYSGAALHDELSKITP